MDFNTEDHMKFMLMYFCKNKKGSSGELMSFYTCVLSDCFRHSKLVPIKGKLNTKR